MTRYLILYAITLVFFFAIDLTWLGVIAKNLYKAKLGFIMSDKVNWAAAIIFYLIYIGGILYFAVVPSVEAGDLFMALIKGGALGFLCYATYDLTNMATITNWPLSIVIIDIIWGTVLTASCAAGTFLVAGKVL
ncbi:MAG: conserved rane protein of unknown function [Bacteroidota bacterium]|nr:conserved rane protein of unknown function [Bacteroidota bacterium]